MESPLQSSFFQTSLFEKEIKIFSQESIQNDCCHQLSSSLGSADSQTSTINSSNNSPYKDYNIIQAGNDNILEQSFSEDKDIYDFKPHCQRSLKFIVEAEEEMLSIWKNQVKKAIVKPIILQNIQLQNQRKQENTQNHQQKDFKQEQMQSQQQHFVSQELNLDVPSRPNNPFIQLNYNEEMPFYYNQPQFYENLEQTQEYNYESNDVGDYQEFDQYFNYQETINYSYNPQQQYCNNQYRFEPNYYNSFQNTEAMNFTDIITNGNLLRQ